MHTRPYSKLSASEKEAARGEFTSGDYPGYDWWDNVYEDAVRMAALIGIEISTTTRTNFQGRTYEDIDIWFSGSIRRATVLFMLAVTAWCRMRQKKFRRRLTTPNSCALLRS